MICNYNEFHTDKRLNDFDLVYKSLNYSNLNLLDFFLGNPAPCTANFKFKCYILKALQHLKLSTKVVKNKIENIWNVHL